MSVDQEDAVELHKDPRPAQLKRFFSLESTGTDSFRCVNYQEITEPDGRNENICGCNLALKLAQLFVGVLSIGMYSTAVLIVPCDQINTRNGTVESRMTSLMFPNIVFTAFLIITSVIALSYVLKQSVSAAVIRIFNVIGMVLYFVSASVSGYVWYKYLPGTIPDRDVTPYVMFYGQILTSLLNAALYGLDVGLSVRRALKVK